MNSRKRILYKFILLSGVIFVLGAVSFSWFSSTYSARVAEDMELGVEDAYKLEISIDGGNTWKFADEFKITGGSSVKPVCGDGKHFFFPEEDYDIQTEGKNTYVKHGKMKYMDVTSTYSQYVYEQEFTVRTERDCSIFLGDGCYVNGGGDSVQSALKRPGGGYYSSGYICAATRVALFERKSSGWQLLYIWVPNPTVQLDGNDTDGYTLIEDGTAEAEYVFPSRVNTTVGDPDNGKLEEGVIISTKDDEEEIRNSGYVEDGNICCGWGGVDQLPSLGELYAEAPRTYKIMLWVDGADRECNNVFQGGTLDFGFEIGSERLSEDAEETEE